MDFQVPRNECQSLRIARTSRIYSSFLSCSGETGNANRQPVRTLPRSRCALGRAVSVLDSSSHGARIDRGHEGGRGRESLRRAHRYRSAAQSGRQGNRIRLGATRRCFEKHEGSLALSCNTSHSTNGSQTFSPHHLSKPLGDAALGMVNSRFK
ncbi:unnamed protein product [Darwinula stevensoni]|uniref:Uncharacterized protein n=1 Tax=Darwinula stevensoni TaxID=69355 RepID=A0A7R9AF57_9CRUS|nr:unnamed protein product [Darwinula stevensoni]CAG0902959.1 unnamed protein product [Darwinula stevensoni]